jgi:hypothetical protein
VRSYVIASFDRATQYSRASVSNVVSVELANPAAAAIAVSVGAVVAGGDRGRIPGYELGDFTIQQ